MGKVPQWRIKPNSLDGSGETVLKTKVRDLKTKLKENREVNARLENVQEFKSGTSAGLNLPW